MPVKKSKPKDTLPKELFGAEVNEKLLATAVRVYLANQREGSAKTKTRGEVEGSTRKIYRQKGTGRARHGSIRAPIFVGGGIVFGPIPKKIHLTMSRSMKRMALLSALSARKNDTKIMPELDGIEPKTKISARILKNAGITGSTLLVVASESKNLTRAARNLKTVDLIGARDLNPYTVLTHKHIIFTKRSLSESVSHFSPIKSGFSK